MTGKGGQSGLLAPPLQCRPWRDVGMATFDVLRRTRVCAASAQAARPAFRS